MSIFFTEFNLIFKMVAAACHEMVGEENMDGLVFESVNIFCHIYSCSPSMALNLFTFFSLGILKVPWDSLVSISKLAISMSLFFTWYSSSKLLTEDNTRFVIQGLAEGSKVVFAHGRDIGEGSNLFEDSFRNTHLGVYRRTPHVLCVDTTAYSALIPLLTLR
eukprot:TRINITY_DN96_c0_g1_i7.p1 TRINITY_DN96_c0_g1~~TRINITY_DN96_c0_g1_i7.p1  ORF type:complete len:162 (+),score=31.44 TRINITY_DN96_c0_g1_i7:37-522(+)